jgi:hypothetical protein
VEGVDAELEGMQGRDQLGRRAVHLESIDRVDLDPVDRDRAAIMIVEWSRGN